MKFSEPSFLGPNNFLSIKSRTVTHKWAQTHIHMHTHTHAHTPTTWNCKHIRDCLWTNTKLKSV